MNLFFVLAVAYSSLIIGYSIHQMKYKPAFSIVAAATFVYFIIPFGLFYFAGVYA